jgi:uncharacterized protein YhdP
MPEQDVGGTASKRSDELRIRASNLDLIWLAPAPTWAKLAEASRLANWRGALDIPLQATEKNPLPGNMERSCLEAVEAAAGAAEHFSGKLEGSVEQTAG